MQIVNNKSKHRNSEGKTDLIQRNKSKMQFLVTVSHNDWLRTGRTACAAAISLCMEKCCSSWFAGSGGRNSWEVMEGKQSDTGHGDLARAESSDWDADPPCDGLKCPGVGCSPDQCEDSGRGCQRNTWMLRRGPGQRERVFCCCRAMVEDHGKWSWIRYSLEKLYHISSSGVPN